MNLIVIRLQLTSDVLLSIVSILVVSGGGRVTTRKTSSSGDVADLGQRPLQTVVVGHQGATGIVDGVLVVQGNHRLRVRIVAYDRRAADHRCVLPVYNVNGVKYPIIGSHQFWAPMKETYM